MNDVASNAGSPNAASPNAAAASEAASLRRATEELTAPGQLFEMEQVDVRGVPTRVWKHAPGSARDVVELSRGHGARDFLVYEDEHITFEEHYHQAATVAQRLRDDFGIVGGDHVALAMRNLPEWVVTFWGVLLAGAVVVPLNAWWTTRELEFGLADSESVVVLCDSERAQRIGPVLGRLPELRGALVTDEHRGRQGPWSPPPDTSLPLQHMTEWLGPIDPQASPPEVTIHPDDDATVFYTSGTTGRPKGAVGTHRNLCTNLMSLYFLNSRSRKREELRREAGVSPRGEGNESEVQQSYLLSVPLFHVTGCLSMMVGATASGGKMVMMHHFDAERALELIERERITVFGGVPSMVMRVLDSPDFGRRDTSSVRSVSYGGAPAPPELVRRIRKHLPTGQPNNGYGLTETSSVTTMNSGSDYMRKPDSVGPPVPVCDVVVVPEDFDGPEPVPSPPPGAELTGELWIRGPNVVRGYWKRPVETAEVITAKGWLRTGDIARIDDEGFVYIVDRTKDTIIRGGENIYSVEVEDALYEHPAVVECAVVGVPHPVLGEEVGAVVVLRPGAKVSADELARHVGSRLAHFMVPVRFWFRDDPLPRNPAGKVLKRALRRELFPGTIPA